MMRRGEGRAVEREKTQYDQIVLRRDGEGVSLERDITEKLSNTEHLFVPEYVWI